MIDVMAQISLYPLRQTRLSPAIKDAVQIFVEHGLKSNVGSMSTLVYGDDEALFDALREAFHRAAEQGEAVMVVTVSNACPPPGPAREGTM